MAEWFKITLPNSFKKKNNYFQQIYAHFHLFIHKMKKQFVLFILFLQLGMLFSKGLIVLHFFSHREEIAAHFCHHATREAEENCQGICYLKAELSKDDNSPVKNFPVNLLLQDDIVYFEIPQILTLKTLIFKSKTTNNFIVKTPVFDESHLSVWRPPAVV